MMEQQLQQQSQSPAVAVDKAFNNECLESHNRYRELHGCPKLQFSAKLASAAQAWANHLASIGQLQHSTPNPRGSYGENIAMKMVSGSREYKGSQCTMQWYSEIEMYYFSGGENQMKCGHFSQVVWKSTKEAGFGKAISPDGKMFAVGQYAPPGNFMNKWRENIPPPLSGQIEVPSKDEIMGRPSGSTQQQQQQQPKQLQQTKLQQPAVLVGPSRKAGDLGGGQGSEQDPEPTDPRDRPVGKATKTRTVNGEKTMSVTVTFARPDGSRYQLTKETSSASGATSQPAKTTRPEPQLEQEFIIQPVRQRRNFAAAPSGRRDDGDNDDADDNVDGDGERGADADYRLDFAGEVERQHSLLRQRHGAPELRRSDSLDSLAQAWAEALCRSGRLRHCPPEELNNQSVGQNIAKRPAAETGGERSGRLAGQQLVQQWYGERHRFPIGQPDPGDIVGGHFSQLVWCSSEELGVGLATDPHTGDQYAACFYRPGGNLAGQFADNVLPAYD